MGSRSANTERTRSRTTSTARGARRPGACESDGVYAYAGKDEKGPLAAEETKWCNMLKNELQAEFAAPEFKRAINYRSRWETPNFAMFMRDEMGVPALSLETPYGHINGTPLTQRLASGPS